MKVSLNWIRFLNKKYGCSADPAPDGIDRLVERIGARLGAVEEVIDVGKKYKGIVVAKVSNCVKHPNADKLSVCLIDDAGAVKDLKRSAEGLVEVVCGAPNVAAGQMVAWIPPGVAVPATIDKEPLVLEAREIRGVVSNGMLASPKELALGDSHEGTLVLDNNVKAGQTLAEALDLNDFIINIENKMFTHRPDLFGMLGVARELAGINHHMFKSPSWYREKPTIPKPNKAAVLPFKFKNYVPKLVPRFCAVVIKDIRVGPSPPWLVARLASVGIKSINNVVDVTNFLMLETAQPLHAYDYDKLAGGLEVRLAKSGENLTILGGKKLKLTDKDIVITSDDRVVGLGGVMGGAESEISDSTKNIVLEVANFDMNSIRRTAMHHGLFTDAATRFTKNQSPRQNLAVLIKALDELKAVAGGRQASEVMDDKHFKETAVELSVSADFINTRLGEQLSLSQIEKLLTNVEFGVKKLGQKITLKVPFWRTDIEIAEDIIEEVGRLFGYEHLPLVLPKRKLAPAQINPLIDFKNRLRTLLSAAGANEVLTYSFVHGSLLDKVGQDTKNSYHIKNALSPDLQYYRQTVLPSLLDKIHANNKLGFSEFCLFELARAHVKGHEKDGLPKESERLAFVYTDSGKMKKQGTAYYHARKYLDYVFDNLNIKAEFKPLKVDEQLTYFAPSRSADVYIDGERVGSMGEFKASVVDSLKLPKASSGFEISTVKVADRAGPPSYQSLNRFPPLAQDISLRVSQEITYQELHELISAGLADITKQRGYRFYTEAVDIYQKEWSKQKQITFRITLEHPDRTLTTKEANEVLDILADKAKKLQAERI